MPLRAVVTAMLGVALVACSADPNLQDNALAKRQASLAATANHAAKLIAVKDPIPGQYIVVLRDGSTAVNSIAAEQANAAGGQLLHTYQSALHGYALRASETSVKRLLEDPRVKYVQQDGVVHADSTQSDPPWGLDRIDHRFGLYDQLYTYNSTGAGVNAYIIDTGIRITHQDFGGRAQYAYDAVRDGNGANDCYGHGTHVAGTVGGSTYGVAKDVNLFAVRVLDCTGSGTWSGVIEGVDWVTANRVLPAVANMSLGGGANQAMDDAVAASVASGVVYAVAGGNSNDDACNYSPARTPSAITVGAIGADDTRAWFSNYGACLDLFGPGVNVLSAWNTDDTSTNTISGTSMATPHVAGTAALYLGLHPSATPAEVTAALLEQGAQGPVLNPGSGSPNVLVYERFIGAGGGGDTTPPTVSLTAPSDGASLSGSSVDITAQASDDVGVEGVVFYVDGSSIAASGATPDGLYATTWDTTTVANGSHSIMVRAFDAEGNIGTSTTINVSVSNVGAAAWDPNLMVPLCTDQGPYCDSANLVNGRGIVGPELHAPNNWYGYCPDGNEGGYHSDESIDRMRVSTLDGTPLAPGKQAQIDVTVWAYGDGSADALDLFYASDASSPNWYYLTTIVPPAGGQQTLSAVFTVPGSTSGVAIVRAAFRFGGYVTTCDDGSWSDRDDLAFKVGEAQSPPVASFTFTCKGLTCQFTDTSTAQDNPITNWYWFFSDSSDYVTEQNPSHHFASSGWYYAALYVVDSQGLYSSTYQLINVTGIPPVASFSASCSERTCSFTDASADEDGAVVSRSWSFGDGYGATLQNPSHAYAAAGSYTVSLTVTDNDGLSSTTMQTVVATDPPVIALTATGSRIKGVMTVDLGWNGATSATLDVYRNGLLLKNTPNDGAERTTVDKRGTYNYRLCQPGTSYCSNTASVVF